VVCGAVDDSSCGRWLDGKKVAVELGELCTTEDSTPWKMLEEGLVTFTK
jgi:hypothetical protein